MAEPVQAEGGKESSYYPAPPAYTPTPQPEAAPYPPAAAPAAPATVVVQPVIVQQPAHVFGQTPVVAMCPEGHQVTTMIVYKNGDMTFLVAAVLCFFLGPIAAVVPFFVDSLKDVEHRCPIDGTVLGVYKRTL